MTPSAGVLDYEQVLGRIRRAEYSGILTIELEGKATYAGILNYVARLKKRMK